MFALYSSVFSNVGQQNILIDHKEGLEYRTNLSISLMTDFFYSSLLTLYMHTTDILIFSLWGYSYFYICYTFLLKIINTFKRLLAYILGLFFRLNHAQVITTAKITMTRQHTAITAIMPIPNPSLQKKYQVSDMYLRQLSFPFKYSYLLLDRFSQC